VRERGALRTANNLQIAKRTPAFNQTCGAILLQKENGSTTVVGSGFNL
jgi:hypothetical protein